MSIRMIFLPWWTGQFTGHCITNTETILNLYYNGNLQLEHCPKMLFRPQVSIGKDKGLFKSDP